MTKRAMIGNAKAMVELFHGIENRARVNKDVEVEKRARENREYYERKIKRLNTL